MGKWVGDMGWRLGHGTRMWDKNVGRWQECGMGIWDEDVSVDVGDGMGTPDRDVGKECGTGTCGRDMGQRCGIWTRYVGDGIRMWDGLWGWDVDVRWTGMGKWDKDMGCRARMWNGD